MFVCAHLKGQKMVLDSLELELRMVVNHHMGDENRSWVLSKN